MELLIVPYGIETNKTVLSNFRLMWLLIVPYGIETGESRPVSRWRLPFNRTLWN